MRMVLYLNFLLLLKATVLTPKQPKLNNEVGARSNLAVSPTGNWPTITQAQNGT